MPAQDVLDYITIIPAQILGFNVCSLEPEKLADITVVDLSIPNLTPINTVNLVENLIWASNENEIQFMISNGKLLVDDYQFTMVNVPERLQQIQELSELFINHKEGASSQKATDVRDNTT